jgi:hypothetical protein
MKKMTVTKKLLLFAGITAVALMFNALTAEPAKHAGPYVGVPKDRVELVNRLPADLDSFGGLMHSGVQKLG